MAWFVTLGSKTSGHPTVSFGEISWSQLHPKTLGARSLPRKRRDPPQQAAIIVSRWTFERCQTRL
jgi:hypothetical protein